MKRFLSLMLTVILVLSVAVVSVSAEEAENESYNVLHFDSNTATHFRNDYEKVYCHIWEYCGDAFFPWQNKKERCTDEDGDGIWTYDLDKNGVVLEDGKLYCVIFSNENGRQTANLLFDKTVLGDTAYCDGTYFDSPEEIEYYYAYWRNQGQGLYDFGPELYIDSIGRVIGTCIPNTKTAQDLFEGFLINSLENARTYSGKADQALVDDLGLEIELNIDDILNAIDNTDVEIEWNWWESPLALGSFTPIIGDVDGDITLSVMDATAIQQYKADLNTISEKLMSYGDIDEDGEISVLDATKIQLTLAQL